MKNLSKIAALGLFICSLSAVTAQNKENPWAIHFGTNAIDMVTTARVDTPENEFFKSITDVENNWDFGPIVSQIGVSRYVGDGFILNLTGSFNRISKTQTTAVANNRNELQYFGVKGSLGYSFQNLINSKWFDPYVDAGAGYTWLEELPSGDDGYGVALVGGGLRFWISPAVNIGISSHYNTPMDINLETEEDYFQHALSLGIAFGGKDTDGDGIYDKNDKCPEVAGIKEFDGCPDTDNDGIQDAEDACPTVAGIAEFNGCADTDKDGIADPKDACPTVAGIKALNGCPDADNDGIKDADDNCPNEAGPAANQGCPYADSDNDGILDKDDKCPNEAGVAAHNGCPEPKEISVEVLNELNVEIKSVLFDNAKATIRTVSYETLDNIADIMTQYSDSNFIVEGHTDSRGRDSYNLKLSQQRADAVKTYLVNKGINGSRIQAKGYGETRPVASNNTNAGRQANRRVELSLMK